MYREDEGDGEQAGEGQHVVEPGGADTRHVEQGEEHHLDIRGVNKVSLPHLLDTSCMISVKVKRVSKNRDNICCMSIIVTEILIAK